MKALFWLVSKRCSGANNVPWKQLRKVGQLGCLHTWKIIVTKTLARTCTLDGFCLSVLLSLSLVALSQVNKEITSEHSSSNYAWILHETYYICSHKTSSAFKLERVYHMTPTWLTWRCRRAVVSSEDQSWSELSLSACQSSSNDNCSQLNCFSVMVNASADKDNKPVSWWQMSSTHMSECYYSKLGLRAQRVSMRVWAENVAQQCSRMQIYVCVHVHGLHGLTCVGVWPIK